MYFAIQKINRKERKVFAKDAKVQFYVVYSIDAFVAGHQEKNRLHFFAFQQTRAIIEFPLFD